MATPILATKLFIPPSRPNLVRRPRLTERLNEGLNRKLTLISAPAGFGKTTLVSDWLAGCGWPAAWLSLDEEDSDATRFLTYVVAAVQTVAPKVGEEALSLLQSPQPPTEAILTTLLNELSTLSAPLVLVLDDYHLVDAQSVDSALTFLLEHLPPKLHIVITTREDPQLPLARLRARGHLTDLRAADLRFTAAEAAEFLNRAMGLSLSAQDIARLEERTEGWIAGLQLAALSMQGQQDIPGFIAGFAGDDRYVVDYLAEEVLRRQPAPVRRFLLETSILDRLSGPLCDAVTDQDGGKATLGALDRGNLFVVPLDDRRRWYRYHRLFADVLRAHLADEQPDELTDLHRRASAWYEHNGEPSEAIRHALAGEDFARAADLVELAVPDLRRSRQEATLLGWLRVLPDELLRCRPVLSNAYAGMLLSSGVLEGVEVRLRDAERWLDAAASADARERPDSPSTGTAAVGMVVADQEGYRRLPGSIAVHRAGYALAQGNVAVTMRYARLALELVPEDDYLGRGGAAGLLGLAYWTSGELEAAHESYAIARENLQRAGYVSDALGLAIALADTRIAQGRLHDAMRTYEQGLRLATASGKSVLPGAADMHVGIGELHRERDDLDAATEHLLRAKGLGERGGLPQNAYRWRVAMARLREAQGDLDGAIELLDEAERLYVSDLFPNVRPVPAVRARVWVRQGRVGEAIAWARERGLSAQDDLSYLREFEHVTLARALLAQAIGDRVDCSPRRVLVRDDSLREAMGLLKRLQETTAEGRRIGSEIEILALQALGHRAQGDLPAALASLERALTLAEPEGYVRVFVDEGQPMASLLEEAAKRGIVPGYVRRLLTALGKARGGTAEAQASVQRPPEQQALVEPLSEREREVLRLLGTDLSGPDIARELVVSLNTMRTHTKNIYAKLGVSGRRAAVRRAAELGLL